MNKHQLAVGRKRKLPNYMGAAIALYVLYGHVAIAQEVAQLQEVVVTAEKRTSTVLETPISVTALSGSSLNERGLSSFSDLVSSVPGVSMRDNGPGQTEFEIQGVTSSGGNSPTVGFYLDGVPLTAPAGAQNGKVVSGIPLYDLERVEVLRGPQGTLYGSGSMGGTIRLITNQPDLGRFQATAGLIASETDGGGLNNGEHGMVNIPLLPGILALRIVGSDEYTAGWIDRTVEGNFPLETSGGLTRGNVLASPVLSNFKDVNNERRKMARAEVTWKAMESLTITPTILYLMDRQGGLSAFDSVPGTLAHYQPFNIAEPSLDRLNVYNLRANYRGRGFEITSETSKWLRDSVLYQDAAEDTQLTFGVPAFYLAGGGLGPTAILEDDPSHQWSEELRVASTGGGRFTWLFGGFYAGFASSFNIVQDVPGLPQALGSPTTVLFNSTMPTKITQKAVFGQITYSLWRHVKLSAGLRRFSYVTAFSENFAGFGSPTASDVPYSTGGMQGARGVNPDFDVSYQPSRDALIYARVAKGFRPGGPNQAIPDNPSTVAGAACLAALQSVGLTSAPQSFNPDSLWSYEIGEKWLGMDRRVSVNASTYYENWSKIQQQTFSICAYPLTFNAGAAHIYGGNIELQGRLTRGLLIALSGGYTNGRYVMDVPVTGTYAGQPLPDDPKWTGDIRISYSAPISGSGEYEFLASAENTYTGARVDGTFYPVSPLPSYDLTNFRIGVSKADGWTAWLFADNVFNRRAEVENATILSFPVPDFNRVLTNQPLTVGVDLSYRFQ
jgi:iron complex outermembrane receptor protein